MSSLIEETSTQSTNTLFEQFNDIHFTNLKDAQNYNPLYENLFDITLSNFNTIQLNHKFRLKKLVAKDNDSVFKAIVFNHKNNQTKTVPVFFKYSPLLDPVKYMIGKYQDNDVTIPDFTLKQDSKIYQSNNSAYTDGFFYFLSSLLLNHHHFIHGIDFYGSYIGLKHGFKVNIEEELSMIHQSDYYQLNKNEKFKILGKIEDYLYNINDSRNYKEKLTIGESNSLKNDLTIDVIDNDINELFTSPLENNIENNTPLTEFNLSIHNKESIELNSATNTNTDASSKTSSSECSSRSSVTDNENDTNSDTNSDSNSDTNSDNDSDEMSASNSESYSSVSTENELHAEIDVFPVNMIALEKCDITFDKYIVNEDISNAEMCAGLMQVIMTLITYQKCFKLTHNDLHTNNIMLCPTEKQHIIYQYENKYYKVPTFGHIYKIIDFGRAIYTFKGINYYSDSFSKEGDATTQYNSEPFYNESKSKVEPNYSFDLCRLACSMFDLVVDEDKDLDSLDDPLCNLIVDWCKDDKGRNVLYKANGDDRYPGFKLYKMIARTVHNHTPHKQLERDMFCTYRIAKNKVSKKTRIVNIDAMSEM